MALIKPEIENSSLQELNNELVDVIVKRKASVRDIVTVCEMIKASVLNQYMSQIYIVASNKKPVTIIPKPKK